METLPASSEIKSSPKPKKAIGRFFKVNLLAIDKLISQGATAEDNLALLALAAGTDASNEFTRSGRRAIAAALGISRGLAGKVVARLVEIGAVTSLESDLAETRNPTALRFHLTGMVPDPLATPPQEGDWATLPNALVQNPEIVANLRRAVAVGGMDALKTLLEIAADPVGAIWPPRIHGETATEIEAEFSLYKLVSLKITAASTENGSPHFGPLGPAIRTLCHFRLVQLDAYLVLPGVAGLTMIDPLGTIDRGTFLLRGAYGPTACLALAIGHLTDPLTRNTEISLPALGRSGRLLAVVPKDYPDARIVLRPRLTMLPASPETLEAEGHQKSEGTAAAKRLLHLIKQHFPEGFAQSKAMAMAVSSGKS